MAQRRSIAWVPLMGAMVAGAALTGVIVWRLNLQSVEGQIEGKRAALEKLALSGDIPPNQEVMDYLTSRQTSLEQRYRDWLQAVSAPPVAEAAQADPQLHFQEQFHEVQRTLERLAAARTIPVPEPLGFPKEIPPSDTVPRLLVQLSLIQETAALILEQGVTVLSSLKVEDPQPLSAEEGNGTFLMRLPVRVRLTTPLSLLTKILVAIERARPLIDVRGIRVVSGASTDQLDVELLLARYLVIASAVEEPVLTEDAKGSPANRRSPHPKSRRETASPREQD